MNNNGETMSGTTAGTVILVHADLTEFLNQRTDWVVCHNYESII